MAELHGAHVEMPEDDLAYLQSCARIRHISTSRLVMRLIRVIARDQLVLSILDDESKAEPRQPYAKWHSSKLFSGV
jgi:hypothetical protein